MNTKFIVEYDDSHLDIIDNISLILKQFGLTIEGTEGEHDGWDEFEILKIEE